MPWAMRPMHPVSCDSDEEYSFRLAVSFEHRTPRWNAFLPCRDASPTTPLHGASLAQTGATLFQVLITRVWLILLFHVELGLSIETVDQLM